MTDPAPNRITMQLVLTGSADELLAAKDDLLDGLQANPGVQFAARIDINISGTECIGQMPIEMTTIEELIGHPGPPDSTGQLDRIRNSLRREQIKTVAQLLERSEEDLLKITHFGQKSLDLIKEKLAEHGLELKPIG